MIHVPDYPNPRPGFVFLLGHEGLILTIVAPDGRAAYSALDGTWLPDRNPAQNGLRVAWEEAIPWIRRNSDGNPWRLDDLRRALGNKNVELLGLEEP